MTLNFYRFRSDWVLDAPLADVYDVLERLADYPAWWPQVRQVRDLGDELYELVCRATLPYDLVFRTRQARRDRAGGVLAAEMSGDLVGFSRWTLAPYGEGTLAVFDEEVILGKPLLRKLAPVARPAFRVNHTLMMRDGRYGLSAYLAGLRHVRTSAAPG